MTNPTLSHDEILGVAADAAGHRDVEARRGRRGHRGDDDAVEGDTEQY